MLVLMYVFPIVADMAEFISVTAFMRIVVLFGMAA